jgi:hypothetical protein
MFGGRHKVNDLYIGHCNELSVHWEKISQPPGTSVVYPEGRSDHTTGLLDDRHIVVIGGCCKCNSWIFDVNNRQWKELKNDRYRFLVPYEVTGRRNHSLSVWKVNDDSVWLILFGGIKQSLVSISDTTLIDLSKSSDMVVILYHIILMLCVMLLYRLGWRGVAGEWSNDLPIC